MMTSSAQPSQQHHHPSDTKPPRLNSWSGSPHPNIQGNFPSGPPLDSPSFTIPAGLPSGDTASLSTSATPSTPHQALLKSTPVAQPQTETSIPPHTHPLSAGTDIRGQPGPQPHAQTNFPAQINTFHHHPTSSSSTSIQPRTSPTDPLPTQRQHSISNPMQQLRPLTLPAHPLSGNHPHQQQQQLQDTHLAHHHLHYNQASGASTPVSANALGSLGGNTYAPSGGVSTPGGAYGQQQQQSQTHPATPTSAVGGMVGGPFGHGMVGGGGNGMGLGVGMVGVQGGNQVVTTYPPRRKAIRAAQACDACRARKAKCDEGRPSCGFCKETAIPCVYREVPPPKQDRTLLQILDRLGRIETLLDAQGSTAVGTSSSSPTYASSNVIGQIPPRTNLQADSGMAALASAATAIGSMPSGAARQSPTAPLGPAPTGSNANALSAHHTYSIGPPDISSREPPHIPAEQILEEDEQLTIPYQHTTAAHKLLWWPSIRSLIDEDYAANDAYIMEAEEKRGGLRIWGRGENAGEGEIFDVEVEDPEAAVRGSYGLGWDAFGGIDGDWVDSGGGGYDQGGSEAVFEDEDGTLPRNGVRSSGAGLGGLNSDGSLKLDHATVMAFLNSYLSNIHILHPILDKWTILKMTKAFLERVSPSPPTMMSSPTGAFAGVTSGGDLSPMSGRRPSIPSVTGKRKRSISVSGGPATSTQPGSVPSGGGAGGRLSQRMSSMSAGASKPIAQKIPRTIHSALVLLVLALGSICLHRKPIPGPVPPTPPTPSGAGVGGANLSSPNSAFTPPYNNTTSTPPYTNTGTPPGNYHHQQQQNSYNPHAQPPHRLPKRLLRNVDVIPGLAYFAKAMEIMGILFGGNELENVQAGLLAGLYWGQLGRVLDSWKWISWACMGCQVLIRMKSQHEKDKVRKDLMLRVFWSCLQLESDVLAELDLPPSGISRLEDSMLLPSGHSTESFDHDVREDDPLMWMYYLAQIALRKLLNRVHTALYKQHRAPSDTSRNLAIARELDFQLEQWKLHLPEPLRWEESDPPSSDINAARLRAKYFGARYIIHRPFVYQVIHGGGDIISGLEEGGGASFNNNNDDSGIGAGRVVGGINGSSPTMGGSDFSQHASPVGSTPGGNSIPVNRDSASIDALANGLVSAQGEQGSSTNASKTLSNSLQATCLKCLQSAVQSTTAFHAFSASRNRPVITNVFGTAHAQFGNLLVLHAAYRSESLRRLVPANVLGELYSKTIYFLKTLGPISAALRRDLEILSNTAEKLDFDIDKTGMTW